MSFDFSAPQTRHRNTLAPYGCDSAEVHRLAIGAAILSSMATTGQQVLSPEVKPEKPRAVARRPAHPRHGAPTMARVSPRYTYARLPGIEVRPTAMNHPISACGQNGRRIAQTLPTVTWT